MTIQEKIKEVTDKINDVRKIISEIYPEAEYELNSRYIALNKLEESLFWCTRVITNGEK